MSVILTLQFDNEIANFTLGYTWNLIILRFDNHSLEDRKLLKITQLSIGPKDWPRLRVAHSVAGNCSECSAMSDREEVAEQPIVSNEDVSLHGNGDVEVKVPRKAMCRSRPKSRKGMPSLRRLSSKLKVSKSGRQSLNVSMVHTNTVITIYLNLY